MSGSKSIRASVLARLLGLSAAVLAGTFADAAHAHGFGQRYDLPLPLSLYLYGTAAIIAVSFAIVGLFVHRTPPARPAPGFDLLTLPVGRVLAHPALLQFVKLIAVGLLVVTVAAGFFGNQNPYRNIVPTLVWIILWVGLVYVSAFLGDLWMLINPWRTIYQWAERLYAKIAGPRELSLCLPYPEALGVWPASAFLLAFAWIELVYPTPAVPAELACFAVAYSLLTWIGMFLFGRDAWLRQGEFFSVVFSTYARLAPTEVRTEKRSELVLRPFGAGILDGGAISPSMVAFVLLLLATVLYDGLLNTPEWASLENAIGARVADPSEFEQVAIRTTGLIAFWLLFLAAYTAVSAMMAAAASGARPTQDVARLFVLTLVPIAIGYHVAHYLVFLLIQGQYIVPLISDPFGWGWNLFGTAGYRVDIGIVGARFAWYAAVTAILLGHVIAVYHAHAIALRAFRPRAAALRSQVPLTALMVIYTFVSLSILAEPLVARLEPARPSPTLTAGVAIPADAVLPEPGSGRLAPVGPDKTATAKLTYRVLGSAFHDGTRTTVADLLYAYAFAYRWGARADSNYARYDPHIDAASADLRRQLAGLRALPSDAVSRSFRIGDVNFVRELFTIDVYISAPPGDPERDALVSPPWSTIPWHLTVLMEAAVERGWAAFSKAEADRRGVEWLDLVRSDQLKERVASLVESFAQEGYRPAALEPLVSAEDARRRWAALAAFHKSKGHFLVTNGPYQLKQWSADSVTLEAFRDLTYPLGVGSYDAYANPRRGYITSVERQGNRLRLSADIETVVKFARSEKIERTPLKSIPSAFLKRATPECRYVVTDDAGRVVHAGRAGLAGDLTFEVDLGRLAVGSYTVSALIAVNDNVMNAEIRRIPLTIAPVP